jgi:predicted RecA/RadA family phage recombinase
MANQVLFKQGSPVMVDHTPGSALQGGDVLVVGDTPFIPHRDIAANVKGALAAYGGVYECTAGAAIAAFGTKLYWDDTNNKVTPTASTHKVFGKSLGTAAADGDKVMVLHFPNH